LDIIWPSTKPILSEKDTKAGYITPKNN